MVLTEQVGPHGRVREALPAAWKEGRDHSSPACLEGVGKAQKGLQERRPRKQTADRRSDVCDNAERNMIVPRERENRG